LEETQRLFSCPYCRVKSYLTTRDYFRYLFPPDPGAKGELVYFPYWRFKGMLFFCGPSGVEHKFIDVSHQAVPHPGMPISVGLRSQALRLKFVAPDREGRFLSPARTFEDIVREFEERISKRFPKPILHQAHVGESVSLLYTPFIVTNKICDAILKTPVSAGAGSIDNFLSLPGGAPNGRIQFLSTLCPQCGWDLEGDPDTMVLPCRNCQSAWYPVGDKFARLSVDCHPGGDEKSIYLPFWRFRPQVTGIELDSYADLIHAANLPKAPQPAHREIPFRFWIPAFKIRPGVLIRLAENFTLAQPRSESKTRLPGKMHQPVTLPVNEAKEVLKTVLAGFVKPRQRLDELIPKIQVTAKRFKLVYLPFEERRTEYVHSGYRIAFNKNCLSHSRNL
jgi:hypothetical protein